MATASIKMNPHRVQGALKMARHSVPKIARANKVPVSTLYAVIDGARPGRDPKVQRSIRQIEAIMKEVLCA